MPTRNTRKIYGAEQIYHVYTRGVAKAPIFLDDSDKQYFCNLLARYLSAKPAISSARVPYAWYGNRIKLLTFCLMKNHMHLLIYQKDEKAMAQLLHSLMTSYSMYFNKKYKRAGPVFQSRYLASLIDKQSYLEHISRYIHLNPKNWRAYKYSSIAHYIGEESNEWIHTKPILELFNNSTEEYLAFISDYEAHKDMLDEIKLELAHE